MEFSYFPYGGSHHGNEIKIQGGRMKKYLFGLGGMLVGAGLMFVFIKGEVRAEVKPEPFVCSEAVESIFQGEAVHNLWHCQIANMSRGLSAKGISCEKKGLIEKVFRWSRINF